jgi:hypothetical protein
MWSAAPATRSNSCHTSKREPRTHAKEEDLASLTHLSDITEGSLRIYYNTEGYGIGYKHAFVYCSTTVLSICQLRRIQTLKEKGTPLLTHSYIEAQKVKDLPENSTESTRQVYSDQSMIGLAYNPPL